jgi:DNA repair protein RecO (recombination protein O)
MAQAPVQASQRAFVLHSIAYSESSLIVELLTENQGRLSVIAKGAKRKGSALRSVLMPFQPIEIAVSGKSELKTLTKAEWLGGYAMPVGDALICGFYVNELIMKLLPKEDPHPDLFTAYQRCVALLGQEVADGSGLDTALRTFEWQLLREVGYAPDLSVASNGSRLEVDREYRYFAGVGFRSEALAARETSHLETVQGQTIAALSALSAVNSSSENIDAAKVLLSSATTKMQAKRLTRSVLNHALDGQKLNSRQILIDLHRL